MRRLCLGILTGYCDAVRRMYKELSDERAVKNLRYSLLGAVVFCMAAHAFAYFNFAPVHDGVNYVWKFAGKWEVSLGRFLQPMYGELRGEYTMPWLSGMLSMLYIGLSAFLINELFEVDKPWMMVLTAGFISANASMTNLTMVFSYVTDAFALALLLACIGAYITIRLPNALGILVGSCCFAASMGIYQSYVLFGGLLLVAHTMMQAITDRRLFSKWAKNWLCYAATVILTAIVYFVMYDRFLRYYGTEIAPVSSYNSPARLASMGLTDLLPLIQSAYESFIEYFFGTDAGKLTLMNRCNIGLFALSGIVFGVYVVKERLPVWNVLLIVAGLVLFPGIAQAVGMLTQHGKIYFLTAHSLFLLYPLMLALIGKMQFAANGGKRIGLLADVWVFRVCVYVLCGGILFCNIRYSNEMYTFRTVQYDKTISYVTRLIDRIDHVPGYERNETEVVFTGYSSAGLTNLKEPDGWQWMEGVNNSSITYLQVLRSFIHMMGEQMNIPLDYSDLPDYASMEEVRNMPAFPDPQCCRMIDGRVLVKLTK